MRALKAQDDVQCQICNNGDYEDEDLIVFCGNCNVAVHQYCYGIESLPEGDWLCYNCELFGFYRGLAVNCILCPKRGGPMKPTNVYRQKAGYTRKCKEGRSGKSKDYKQKDNSNEKEDRSLSL